jgi:cysteine-rich repeat protein
MRQSACVRTLSVSMRPVVITALLGLMITACHSKTRPHSAGRDEDSGVDGGTIDDGVGDSGPDEHSHAGDAGDAGGRIEAACGNGAVEDDEECDDGNQAEDDDCLSDCKLARCGDDHSRLGVEDCDDGNDTETDDCLNDCTMARCGDGAVHAGSEACDDGNDVETDDCHNDCTAPSCGDSVVHEGYEACDDGNAIETDDCHNDCTAARCGDGVVHEGSEACDDGNDIETDDCHNDCTAASCGDSIVHAGSEACDDGNAIETDDCLNDCRVASCGDGAVHDSTEACDDGNAFDTDDCRNDCTAPSCGDGVVHTGTEACDDGNAFDTDGCLNDCSVASCGDGAVHAGTEACDDGNALDTDGCLNDCTVASCGDGIVETNIETCDDQNQVDTDSCPHTCASARCGDGFLQAGVEVCDDGNTDNTDACTNLCLAPVCGDGYVTSGVEECDDGNLRTDDACDACVRTDRIIANGGTTCMLRADGSARCWGFNAFGQAGVGSMNDIGSSAGQLGTNLVPIDAGTDRKILDIAAGEFFFCALLDDATVKCWGDNRYGQLGLGDTINRGAFPNQMGDNLAAVDLGTDRTVKGIAAGGGAACAILDNDTLKCWGANAAGQLGQGDTNNRGDDSEELGDDLQAIDVGTGRHATQVAIGETHTCARLDDDSLKCWGNNALGQLGLGDTVVRGDDVGEMGDDLPDVQLGTGRIAVRVYAAGEDTCALLDDSRLKCWGKNDSMSLVGTATSIGANSGEMGDDLLSASLGTGRTVTSFAMSDSIACATLDDQTVKCWGSSNAYGGLGYGDMTSRGSAPSTIGDNLLAVDIGTSLVATHVEVGSYHACALLDDHRIKCWGSNFYGELANGDTSNRGDDPNEMGDNLPFALVP